MIPARIKDQELVSEIAQYGNDANNFHLWWLGQSGYLLMYRGEKILIDPYLSDSLTRKYAATKKPHVRMSERVINPDVLTGILAVTSSHNHTDHLDGETLIPIIRNNPHIKFIVPEANRKFVCERVQCPADFPIGLDSGESITIGAFTFHGVPAKHNEIEKDEQGRHKFMGYVITFGDFAVYHSGDTLWYEDMVNKIKPFDIDLAILPINGNDPKREVAGNLNATEAAKLAKELGAKLAIPCHYDMFEFNTANPADFAAASEQFNQPYKILPQGGHLSFPG